MSSHALSALDGKNPLGFLAALGALDAASPCGGDDTNRLAWSVRGSFHAVLHTALDRGALIQRLVDDAIEFRDEPAIQALRYHKGGDPGAKVAHDLKPRPSELAAYLRGLKKEPSDARNRRSLDFAASFATDVVTDNNGNAKPTALHFTAGQQEFLAMVAELAAEVTAADFEEALFGPWRYQRALPVLQWDNASTRDYALRAGDPSKGKLGVPGADWLAFRGLRFFPVAAVGDRLVTPCCDGEWKTGTFRWPLWESPLSRRVISSLLGSRELFHADPETLSARGIGIVFEAGIRRSEQGGYGSFTPARVARPARR